MRYFSLKAEVFSSIKCITTDAEKSMISETCKKAPRNIENSTIISCRNNATLHQAKTGKQSVAYCVLFFTREIVKNIFIHL